MSKRVLLQGDVDAIKSYVFEASGLPQIRGGSQRLVECEEQVREYVKDQGGKEIYCSGGGFLFEIPGDKVGEIKRGIEQIYLNQTLVATVTVVYEDAPDVPSPAPNIADGWAGRLRRAYQEAQDAGEFARRTTFLAARLREAKQKKRTAPFVEAFPFGKRCEICGKRVAEHVVRYPDETKRLCSVCYQRYQTGKEERKVWPKKLAQTLGLDIQIKIPQDTNELVESARRPYLAFLYADGNNIGRLLQQVKDEPEYKALSQGLREGTKRALFEALWDVCRPTLQKGQVWPFEILNIGGDDVTLLIQAGYAWDVAIAFLDYFERYVQEEIENSLGRPWPTPITASVGIAIVDAKHPVHYMEALATDLLTKAKAKARQTKMSAINFLWLPNAFAVTKAESVVEQYRLDDFYRTARPFTLAQAKKIQEVVAILAQWPRSLRHRWGEALEHSRWATLSQVLYDLARRMSGDRREKAEQLIAAFANLAAAFQVEREDDLPVYFWWSIKEDSQRVWQTPLLDALELAELRAMRPDIQEEDD